MIVLLSCFTTSLTSKSATIPSTGGRELNYLSPDSVYISYDDLRKVNGKLIELEYEKEINANYRNIVNNDSIAINSLNNSVLTLHEKYNRDAKKLRRERNISYGISVVSLVLLIISLL